MNHFTKRTASTLALGLFVVAAMVSAAQLSAQAAPPASKVAVIDVRRIIIDSKMGRTALDRLRELAEQKQQALTAMEQEAVGLQESLEQQRLSLSEDKISELEGDLQAKAVELRRAQDDARRNVEESQIEEFGKIEEKVMPLIEEIGDAMGYTLIFNKFEDSGLLFAADGADITDLVLQRFDALPEGD